MKRIAVTGMGKVGSLVGTLLADMFDVTGIDRQAPASPVNFPVKEGNVADPAAIRNLLSDQDAVVSCLPWHLNLAVARAAHELGIHYFDLRSEERRVGKECS